MSQKTNPISLRLQKSNKTFSSCYYSDFFYNEITSHQFFSKAYLESLFSQTAHVPVFLSFQNYYAQSGNICVIHDNRGTAREKEFESRVVKNVAFDQCYSSQKLVKQQRLKLDINVKQDEFAYFGVQAQENLAEEQHCSFRTQIELDNQEMAYKLKRDLSKRGANGNQTKTQMIQRHSNEQTRVFPQKDDTKSRRASTYHQNRYIPGTQIVCVERTLERFFFLQRLAIKCSYSLETLDADASSMSISNKIENKFFETANNVISKARFNCIQKNNSVCSLSKNHWFLLPIRVVSYTLNACLIVSQIVNLLEKRVSWRRINSLILREFAQDSTIKGIRLSCSGRVGGRSKKAQKAKMQKDGRGSLGLHSFSSRVHFASQSAHTAFGKVGVKVWLAFK